MSEYLTDINMTRDVMRGAAQRLCQIARALDTIGNEALANKIYAEAEMLDETQVRLRHAVTEKLNADHSQAMQGVGAMLTFLLRQGEKTP